MRPQNQILISRVLKAQAKERGVKPLSDVQIERELRKDKIRAILQAAGIEVDEGLGPDSLSPYNPESLGGINSSLDRLVYDPSNENPIVPWLPKTVSDDDLRALVKELKVPGYATWFRDQAAERIIRPNTSGMLTADYEPNKDLAQLASLSKNPELSATQQRWLDLAIEYVINGIKSSLKEKENDLYYINEDGTCRLIPWTLNTFTEEMKKAISHSSPGYPYNGYSWNDNIEGIPVYERVFNDGMALLHKDPEPFIFLQGARYTGDGLTEGQQRLVQQSPANEKLLGHIIAYPIKQYIRYPGSGQLGIQQASVDIREMAAGNYNNFRETSEKPKFFMENDVSRWDAHIGDYQFALFERIIRSVYDMTDPFTASVVDTYFRCMDLRYLVTGVGGIKTRMLPSGCANTTTFAFIIHEVYIRMGDIAFCAPRSKTIKGYLASKTVGITSLGLQGDDLWALVNDIGVRDTLISIYELFGCKMKEGSRFGSLDDEDPCMVFLNELIHLTKDVPNVVVPRWNAFYSESADQNFRTIDMDRGLYSEITSKVPHVTPVELTFARFVGKMRRYAQMEFFKWFIRRIWSGSIKDGKYTRLRGMFDLRSWLGERMFSNDDIVVKALEDLENNHLAIDKRRPAELELRMVDRNECAWLNARQLTSAYYLAYAAASKLERREFFTKMRSISLTSNRQRVVKRICRDTIESDQYKDLSGVAIDVADIAKAAEFFEEVAVSVISHFAEASTPSAIEDDDEDPANLEVDEGPKQRKLRQAPTVQQSTNAIIGANNVDPYSVMVGSLKEAAWLYNEYGLTRDYISRSSIIENAAIVLGLNIDEESLIKAEEILKSMLAEAKVRK